MKCPGYLRNDLSPAGRGRVAPEAATGRGVTVAVPEACGASQTLTANPDTLDGMGANDRPGLRPTSDREHPSCPAVAFSRRS